MARAAWEWRIRRPDGKLVGVTWPSEAAAIKDCVHYTKRKWSALQKSGYATEYHVTNQPPSSNGKGKRRKKGKNGA